MPSDATSTTPVEATANNDGSTTILNAIIGAVTGIVLSFIPFSTVLGGAVAGYLQGGEPSDGVRVGAIAGVIMLVPFVLIGTLVLMFVLGFGVGGPPLAFGMFAIILLIFGALYIVGLSALGGFLGIYAKREL